MLTIRMHTAAVPRTRRFRWLGWIKPRSKPEVKVIRFPVERTQPKAVVA